MPFKNVPVKPHVKDKISLLKIRWGLRSENEVIERLIERSGVSEASVDNAMALIEWLRENEFKKQA